MKQLSGQLAGQVALITGAAGGIGSAIARLFAAEGATVALFDRANRGGEQIAETINQSEGQARFWAVDSTQSTQVAQTIQQVVAHFGKLTSVVNSIGLLRAGPIEELSEEDFDAVMAVNVKGVFLTIKHALPALKANGSGTIVNLSSVSALIGSEGGAAYHTSKGAVLSLSYTLAQELAPYQIRVNAICPGWVDAGFTHQALRDAADPEALRVKASQLHALGRMAKPEEVAQAALFLASSASSFTTGTALFVDGGFMIKR